MPGIIEWPKIIKPRVTNYPVSTMDIYPTILEIVGINNDHSSNYLDGESIFEIFNSEKQKRTSKIPFRFDNRGAYIYNDIKLVVHDIKKLDIELFDLSNDPYESVDISQTRADLFKLMKEEYLKWNQVVVNEIKKNGVIEPVHWRDSELYDEYFKDWLNRPEYNGYIQREWRGRVRD